MTLKQTQNHLWLQIKSPKKRLRKLSSHAIQMSEDFHYEMSNNIRHANSKEEGSFLQKKCLNKSVNLINQVEYDLTDSDEEEIRISQNRKPKRDRFSIKTDQFYST